MNSLTFKLTKLAIVFVGLTVVSILFLFAETTNAYHDCTETCTDQSSMQCGDYGCCEGVPASSCISCTYSGCRPHGQTPTNFCPTGQLNPHNACFNGQCMPAYYCGVSSCNGPDDCQLPPPPPPVQCGSPCVYSTDCASGDALRDGCTACLPGAGGGLTCQRPPAPPPPGPQCNSSCVRDADCTGDAARNGCTVCSPNTNGVGRSCQPPSPQCNSSCTRAADCTGDAARAGCTACLPGAGGILTCQRPATPPPPSPQCNSSCTRAADCTGDAARNGCTVCLPGAGGILTCQRPAVPPPPAFKEDMCKCDGIDYTAAGIVAGQKATITAYYKVVGSDVNVARVSNVTFRLAPLPGGTVLAEGIMPVEVVINTPTLVRYKSTWEVTIPTSLKSGTQYQIFSRPNCQPKTSSVVDVGTSNVLGISTQRVASFLDDLINFIRNLFSGEVSTQSTTTPPPPIQPPAQSQEGGDQLQLRVIRPANITDKRCQSINFQFVSP